METPDILALLKNPTFWVVIAWLARELWRNNKHKTKEHTDALKENSEKLMALTLTMTKLEVKLQAVDELAKHIPKMKEDLTILHGRVRSLSPSYGK